MTFSETEKKLVKEIITNKGLVSLENLLDSHLKNGYSIYADIQTSKIWFDSNIKMHSAISESEKLYRLVTSILFLLNNLEKHRLIYTMKINSGVFPKKFGKCNINLTYSEIDLFDDICWLNLLKYYLNREILASEDLILLVKNDFSTEEEIKFKKQLIATWAGIILAFIGAIASPYIQNALEVKSQKECNCDLKIDHEPKIHVGKNNSITKQSKIEGKQLDKIGVNNQ